jgi:hypothetical protein
MLVAPAGLTPGPMIKVDYHQVKFQFRFQAVKQIQQDTGVNSPGHSGQDRMVLPA